MLEVCAVCGEDLDEDPITFGIGSMLFHHRCRPACRFCERPYVVQEAGLAGATFDRETRWPEGFKPHERGARLVTRL